MTNFGFPPLFEKKLKTPNYLLWELIVLALFENFKFNYESLGTSPLPEEEQDVHPYSFLKQLKSYQPKEYYFNEKNHVHFNSFIGYGNEFTGYPMKERTAFHHFTLEAYQFIWFASLYYISNWQETFPLLFSTEHNYFLESCNSVFLESQQYLNNQNYPAPSQLHEQVFKPESFTKMNLPTSLLLKNFSIKTEKIHIPEELTKTLNFCLRIFQTAVLIQAALMEIFGKSNQKKEQLEYLQKNWEYPKGTKIKGLSLPRLNLLSFLYLSLHPAATVLCYGLYRNKYGVAQSHRTAFYVKYNNDFIALKDFLKEQVQSYLNLLNQHLSKRKSCSKEIKEKILSVLDLARMFGIGYETNKEKGVNIHKNAPKDFSPLNLSKALSNIDFIVEHNPHSPLWRIFYDYCGEWWSKEEIEEILAGKGPHWKKLKNSPRSMAVHIFHKLAAYFWKENLKDIELPEKIRANIIKRYNQILH